MTDGDSLHRALMATPDEDTLRLVLADWYEESGRYRLAALLRDPAGRTLVKIATELDVDLVTLEERFDAFCRYRFSVLATSSALDFDLWSPK